MMGFAQPVRGQDGSILIPRRVTGVNGTIGDAMERIYPNHPDYDRWDRYLRNQEQPDTFVVDGKPDNRPSWVRKAGNR